MAESAGRPRFPGETVAELGGVVVAPQELDRDVPANARVAGAEEGAHSALSDEFDDFVAADRVWNLHERMFDAWPVSRQSKDALYSNLRAVGRHRPGRRPPLSKAIVTLGVP